MKILMLSHSWNSPLLRGEGRTFQKLSHLGVQNVLLERGDKPEKGGGGVDTFLLLCSSIAFTVFREK